MIEAKDRGQAVLFNAPPHHGVLIAEVRALAAEIVALRGDRHVVFGAALIGITECMRDRECAHAATENEHARLGDRRVVLLGHFHPGGAWLEEKIHRQRGREDRRDDRVQTEHLANRLAREVGHLDTHLRGIGQAKIEVGHLDGCWLLWQAIDFAPPQRPPGLHSDR